MFVILQVVPKLFGIVVGAQRNPGTVGIGPGILDYAWVPDFVFVPVYFNAGSGRRDVRSGSRR